MGVARDTFVMICAEVPRDLWVRENPCAPGYMTCVEGFYEAHEDLIKSVQYKGSPGSIGILYDGMSTNYCWFGLLISAERAYDRLAPCRLTLADVASHHLVTAERLVARAYERQFGSKPENVNLRVIAHYH